MLVCTFRASTSSSILRRRCGAARTGALPAFIKYDRTGDQNFRYSSVVMVFPSDDKAMPTLSAEGWQKASVDPSVPNWTNNYSNILGLLVKRYVSK